MPLGVATGELNSKVLQRTLDSFQGTVIMAQHSGRLAHEQQNRSRNGHGKCHSGNCVASGQPAVTVRPIGLRALPVAIINNYAHVYETTDSIDDSFIRAPQWNRR